MKKVERSMKKFLLLFFMIAMVGNFSSADPVGFKTVDEAVKKLSTYKPSDLKGEKERFKAGKPMNIDKMYADLEAATKLVKNTPITEDLAYEMERVALITIINNPMAGGVMIILPAYIKYTDEFINAAARLDEYDEKVILDSLEGHRNSEKGQD